MGTNNGASGYYVSEQKIDCVSEKSEMFVRKYDNFMLKNPTFEIKTKFLSDVK